MLKRTPNRIEATKEFMIDINVDWSQIETVLLDMDGTLLDLHYDNYFWRQHLPAVYAEQKGISPDDALEELELVFTRFMGTLDWYCVDFWSTMLSLDIMRYKQEVAHKIGYRPNAQSFLQLCRENVSDLRLITNAHRKVLDLKIVYTELDQYFDCLICSHELNAPKEDVKFWHNLSRMASFNPKTSLFIDDSEPVLDAAASYGIGHIFSIEKPDSKQERSLLSKYPMI